MNAVKRCLALIAATLVVGACGGDPIPGAGTDLSIRATPGAVWVRNNTTASVIIEAVDKLGGPAQGDWTVGTITGPFTVARDTGYQTSSTGPLGLSAKFVITPTAEGEGSVVFNGTGGTTTVPIRIAPDTSAFHLVADDSTPTLFQPITLTAPAGIVFTGASVVRFYTGPLSLDTANGGIAFSSTIGLSADSSQLTFVMGPGAHGTMRINGLASRSTPGLTSTARSDFALGAVATVDTNSFSVTPTFIKTGNLTSTSVFDTLVLVAPANYRFLASTKVEFFRNLAANVDATSNPTGYTVVNGTSKPKILGISANSDTLKMLVAVGARGRLKVSNIAFDAAPGVNFFVRAPAAELFNLTSSIDTANFLITFNKTSPVAEGDTVTATAPVGLRFFATTVSIHATSSGTFSGGDSARVVPLGYSADSTSLQFIMPPGASGKVRFSSMGLKADPEIRWSGRSAATLSAVAAPAVVATVTPAAGNMNDTIAIALDSAGPYRFRPTSNAFAASVLSPYNFVSLDSLTLKILPTPNTNAPVTLTNIQYAGLPKFLVQANTAGNVQVNGSADLAADDVLNGFGFNAPTASGSNNAKGFWDATTMTDADPSPSCDGGSAAQFYRMHVSVAGSYTVTVNWNVAAGGTDIDMGVMKADGSYDGGGAGCGDYLTTSGLSGAKPEANNSLSLAVGDYIIAVIDYNGTTAATDAISIRVIKN